MAKITCALRKEQIGLLIQYTASYMRGVDKYNMVNILTPLQKVVGEDIIQYASILPDTISSIMVLDRKTFKKSNSVDQFQELAESFEDYDAVEKYLIDNSIIKKETLFGAKTPVSTDIKADIEKRRQEKLTKAEESAKPKIDEWQKKADEDIKRNGVISKPVSNALDALKGTLFNELERINEAFDKELLDNNIPNAKELIEKRKTYSYFNPIFNQSIFK
jgi:hypothetical protein